MRPDLIIMKSTYVVRICERVTNQFGSSPHAVWWSLRFFVRCSCSGRRETECPFSHPYRLSARSDFIKIALRFQRASLFWFFFIRSAFLAWAQELLQTPHFAHLKLWCVVIIGPALSLPSIGTELDFISIFIIICLHVLLVLFWSTMVQIIQSFTFLRRDRPGVNFGSTISMFSIFSALFAHKPLNCWMTYDLIFSPPFWVVIFGLLGSRRGEGKNRYSTLPIDGKILSECKAIWNGLASSTQTEDLFFPIQSCFIGKQSKDI